MTDTQRAIVASALFMFAERYGWDKLSDEEQDLAKLAKSKQTNPRYMDHYV